MILGFIDGKELYEVLKIRRQLPEDEACLLTMQVHKILNSKFSCCFRYGIFLVIMSIDVLDWQVLRGVEYLHRKGIVHRDLTPRNLLVKESGHALVIDLGLAVELADDGGDAQEKGHAGSPVGAVGTTGYIAPEVLRHEKVLRLSRSE
jgi:serine/threonine protein kinase